MEELSVSDNILDETRSQLEQLNLWHDRINGGLEIRAQKLLANAKELIDASDVLRNIHSRMDENCQNILKSDTEYRKVQEESENLKTRLAELDKEYEYLQGQKEFKWNSLEIKEEELDKELQAESRVYEYAKEDLQQATENKLLSQHTCTSTDQDKVSDDIFFDPEVVKEFKKLLGLSREGLDDIHADIETTKRLLLTEKQLEVENASLRHALRQRMHELMAVDVQTFLAEHRLHRADSFPAPTKACDRLTNLLTLHDDYEESEKEESSDTDVETRGLPGIRHDGGICLHRCSKVTDLSLVLKSEEDEDQKHSLLQSQTGKEAGNTDTVLADAEQRQEEPSPFTQETRSTSGEENQFKETPTGRQVSKKTALGAILNKEGNSELKEGKKEASGIGMNFVAKEKENKPRPGPSADFNFGVSMEPAEKLNSGLVGPNLRKRADGTRSPSSSDLTVGGADPGLGNKDLPLGAMALCKQSSAKSAEPTPANARLKRSSFK